MRDMEGLVMCVAFSPDESHIVAMSDDDMVSFWDVLSGLLSSKTKKVIHDPSCNLQVCSVSMVSYYEMVS
jgi:WD40 repeat protein